MTTVDVGPFRLIDPPPGQEALIRATIAAIDYPWERLAAALTDDPEGCVTVEWGDTGQGTSGLFYGYSIRILLSDRSYHLEGGRMGFVFAHEVGHMVDRVDLRDEDRQALMDLTHGSPSTYRDDERGQTFNGTWWPTAHANPHDEQDWSNGVDSYALRHNEAYADMFVEAFAPTVWDGSFYPDAPSRDENWVRFVHTTDDLDSVVRLTLWTPPQPDPRDEEPAVKDHAHLIAVGGNVRNNPPMSSERVREDYAVMAAIADVAFINECGRARYRHILRRVMPRKDWRIVGLYRSETPICVRRKSGWNIKSSQVVRLHDGEAKVTPARKLVTAVLTHDDLPGIAVEAQCTHLVSGAWNRKHKFRKALRKKLWRLSRRKLNEQVKDSDDAIVFFGDLNKREVEELGIPRLGELDWVAGENGILKMGVRSSDTTRVKVRQVETLAAKDLNTDHPFIVAKLSVFQED